LWAPIAARDSRQGLALVHKLMTDGASLNEFCHQVVEQLRAVMVLQMTNDPGLLDDLPGETVQQMQMQAKQMDLPTTLYAIKRFSTAVNELKGGFQPQLPLEMALIEVVQGEARPPATVIVPAPVSGCAGNVGQKRCQSDASRQGRPLSTRRRQRRVSRLPSTPKRRGGCGRAGRTSSPWSRRSAGSKRRRR
jgi:DNA polymerase III gamma/tau subunit